MSDIQVFNNPQFGDIRTSGTASDPMFCLADLCRVLEIRNVTDARCRLDQKGLGLTEVLTSGGKQQMYFVNEKNLYRLIMRSDKPQAEPFQDWVCGEVLPSIRKHGAYMTSTTIDSIIADPDNGIRLLQALKEERQQRQLAESKAALLEEVTKEQAPKVAFADAVLSSPDSILVGELAKILCQRGYKTGEIRLYEQLRREGFLCSFGSDYNMPMQRYLEMGLFEVTKGTRSGAGGVQHVTRTTKVTPKGQQYFINRYIH